jgi:glycosyltransferase involved in cell wall biosynthesis
MIQNKKKIAYIAYRDDLETNLEHISRIVSESKYDVRIYKLGGSVVSNSKQDGGRVFRCFKKNRSRSERINKLLFVIAAVKDMRKYRPAIVHIESSCKYFGFMKLLAPRSKYVYHALSYPMYKKRWQVLKRMLSVYLQCLFMDAVIIQSEAQKKQWLGIRNFGKTCIVPVGYEDKALFPIDRTMRAQLRKKLGFDADTPILVYAGTMKKTRNLVNLLMAMKILTALKKHVLLLMIGDENQDESLRNTVHRFDLGNFVKFMGSVPHHEIVNYYGLSDIGISYIPINKNFTYNPPLKTYEYLACGKPCIATKTISNYEIMKDGLNGILVDDSPKAVAKGMLEILEHEAYKNYDINMICNSVKDFTFKKIVENKVVPIYSGLTKAK